MAPLPENSTRRWWVDYSVAGEDHSMMFRSADDITASDAGGTAAAFLAAITSQLRELTITGFRTAAEGSNVSLPAVWPGASTYGSGAGAHSDSANMFRLVGRDDEGRRVTVGVFGANNATLGGDYRISAAESTIVADAIAVLSSDASIFVTILGHTPVWNNYVNIGPNAYWRDKIR